MKNKKTRKNYIPSARKIALSELAEAVAFEHCPGEPIAPVVIAENNNITISYDHYGDCFAGMLEHLNGRFHIYCNQEDTGSVDSPRTRFTLAHELGHYYIDEHRNALIGGVQAHNCLLDFSTTNPVECEANFFASNLLMPKGRFLNRVERPQDGIKTIRQLTMIFATSIISTAIRFIELEPARCALLCWKQDKQSNWTLAWNSLSKSLFQERLRVQLDDVSQLPLSSVTKRAALSGVPNNEDLLEGQSSGAIWFPSITSGRNRDFSFIEQVFPIGRYGLLTLLIAE